MAVLTFATLTQDGYGPATFSGTVTLEAGSYVAWRVPRAARAFARLSVDVLEASSYTIESGPADEERIAAGTQLLQNPYGGAIASSIDEEFTPAGIFVVSCASGSIRVNLEAK
jgi:hypothetical protein